MPISTRPMYNIRRNQNEADSKQSLFFDPENEGDMSNRNVGWISTGYTVLYPRRQNFLNAEWVLFCFSRSIFIECLRPWCVTSQYITFRGLFLNLLHQIFILGLVLHVSDLRSADVCIGIRVAEMLVLPQCYPLVSTPTWGAVRPLSGLKWSWPLTFI
jgi:hypothetical protein